MTAPEARGGAALLARKGHAAPLGAATAETAADTALEPAPTGSSDAQDASGTQTESAPAEAAPAASLLPFDFLAGRHGPPDPALLLSDAAEAKLTATAEAAPEGPAPGAGTEIPRADPALRIDAGTIPARAPAPRRFPALAAGLALVLVLGAAGYAYRGGWFAPGPESRPHADAPGSEAAPTLPQATDTALAPADAPAGTPSESSAGASSRAAPTAPLETTSAPGAEVDQVPEAGTPETATSEMGAAAEAIPPSVDVVRIEPDGAAVIAGRAAPGAELILLDNGAPIGTAQADAYGEWVFVPVDPLPSGAHDFGLVIKKIEGGASVPPPEQPPANQDAAAPGGPGSNEPGTVAGAAAAVPIPPRKPNTGAAQAVEVPAAAFVVQLASLKTRRGAEREWQSLQRRFPEILAELTLNLDEAKLDGGDTVVRLRTGAFVKQDEAAALCRRLAAKHQDCLVVRTAAKP